MRRARRSPVGRGILRLVAGVELVDSAGAGAYRVADRVTHGEGRQPRFAVLVNVTAGVNVAQDMSVTVTGGTVPSAVTPVRSGNILNHSERTRASADSKTR